MISTNLFDKGVVVHNPMLTFIKALNEIVKKIIILTVSYMFDLPLPSRFPGCTYKQFNNTPEI